MFSKEKQFLEDLFQYRVKGFIHRKDYYIEYGGLIKMTKVDLESWQMHMIREIVLNHEYSKTWFTSNDLQKLKKRVQGWI